MDQSNKLMLKDINKYYPSPKSKKAKHALVDFNYTFQNGIYILTGPNGAGKSTLLNILTGYLYADSGQILWNDTPLNTRSKSYKSLLGYMPQQQLLHENMTVIQFMNYMSILKGLSKKETIYQVDTLLTMVNLTSEASSKLDSLSGGMKQRLLFAQSLLGTPKILLLDEPTVGVDASERSKMLDIISKNCDDKIVIMSTHISSDKSLFDAHEIKLENGVLIQ